MKRLSKAGLNGIAISTLAAIVPAIQLAVEQMANKPIFEQSTEIKVLYLVLSVIGYGFYYNLAIYLGSLWRFRDWRGDWFYLSKPDPSAQVRDGGFAWMRFNISEGDLVYQVTRYETLEDLEAAYLERDRLGNVVRNIIRPFDPSKKSRRRLSHKYKDVSAYSETIKFDDEKNKVIVFYHVTFTDRTLPDRQGRLELELEGSRNARVARGVFSSVEANAANLTPSHGYMFAHRNMWDLEARQVHDQRAAGSRPETAMGQPGSAGS